MAKKGKSSPEDPVFARNRKASHEYLLLDRYEAGIALTGTEVKSIRAGRVNLQDAYAQIREGEAMLFHAHISPYEQGNRENHDPERARKLLLHSAEIRKLARATESGGTTLVPLRVYLKNGRFKVEIAVARGKKSHDKREAVRQREAAREIARSRGGAWSRGSARGPS